jgi:hypothetical protein
MLKEYISEKLDGKFKLSNEGYDKWEIKYIMNILKNF